MFRWLLPLSFIGSLWHHGAWRLRGSTKCLRGHGLGHPGGGLLGNGALGRSAIASQCWLHRHPCPLHPRPADGDLVTDGRFPEPVHAPGPMTALPCRCTRGEGRGAGDDPLSGLQRWVWRGAFSW